jgi:hypothetical protein
MLTLLTQLYRYLRTYRKFWMAPIILLLLTVGGLLVAVQGTAIAPFIYAIF